MDHAACKAAIASLTMRISCSLSLHLLLGILEIWESEYLDRLRFLKVEVVPSRL